ncbi:hypothetical protein VPHK404_0013 [Vibrio phage K404]
MSDLREITDELAKAKEHLEIALRKMANVKVTSNKRDSANVCIRTGGAKHSVGLVIDILEAEMEKSK